MTLELEKNSASTVFIDTDETSFATFCYTKKGELFLNSDWGNYFYSWRAFQGEFETFLKGLNLDYLVSKLESNRESRLSRKQKEVLTKLCELFIKTLRENKPREVYLVPEQVAVNGYLLGEHYDIQSFFKNVSSYGLKYGVLQKIIHIDNNGFCTTGYDLKNTVSDNVYPVKSYLLKKEVEAPKPYKTTQNN